MTDRPLTAFKVLTEAELGELEGGSFAGSAVDRADGFIHLSTAAQLAGTIDKHFAGATGLCLAAVDLAALGDSVRWEVSRGGDSFPHIYGALTLDAVIAYGPLERDAEGAIRLPIAG